MTFRNFSGGYGVSEDYLRLHDFLAEIRNETFTYARLDWMITHAPYLQIDFLPRIGLWEEDGRMVAAALFDTSLDDVFLLTRPGYAHLYPEMIAYAKTHMVNEENPSFRLFIDDGDDALQRAALAQGFHATEYRDFVARHDLSDDQLAYTLPEGYTIVSLQEEPEFEKYLTGLSRGFDDEEPVTAEDVATAQAAFHRVHVNLDLKVSVKAPDGSYVAHCGMWYDPAAGFALVEPVATVPAFRRMGLGKAAVLEGLRRVKALGAQHALVGSGQQFYYAIGFRPVHTGSSWVLK